MSPDDGPDLLHASGQPDRAVHAAEIALGLAPDRARALAADPSLRAEVEAWEADFAALADELPSLPPRPSTWAALRVALEKDPRPDRSLATGSMWRRLFDSLAIWRGAAAAGWAGALAILALAVWTGVPDRQGPVAPHLLVSSLLPKEGAPLYVAAYDRDRAQLVVVPAAPLREQGRTAQLWLVPNDTDDPIALSPIGTERLQVVPLTADQVRHVIEGAGLVVTLEPDSAPNPPTAQGRVVAHGRLARA